MALLKNIFSLLIDAHERIDGKNLIDAPPPWASIRGALIRKTPAFRNLTTKQRMCSNSAGWCFFVRVLDFKKFQKVTGFKVLVNRIYVLFL